MDDEIVLTRQQWDDMVYVLKLFADILSKHELNLDEDDMSRIDYLNLLLKNINDNKP